MALGTAVTTRPASLSFQLRDSLMLIANGWSLLSMEELAVRQLSKEWCWKSPISRSVLASHRRVCPLVHFLPCYPICCNTLLLTSSFIAMSRRIATDQGGKRGPQSSRIEPTRRNDRDDRPGSSGNGNANNGIPNMPFPFPTMPIGMPMFPPGFPFPLGQQNNDQK